MYVKELLFYIVTKKHTACHTYIPVRRFIFRILEEWLLTTKPLLRAPSNSLYSLQLISFFAKCVLFINISLSGLSHNHIW